MGPFTDRAPVVSRFPWDPASLDVMYGPDFPAVEPWPDLDAAVAWFDGEAKGRHERALGSANDATSNRLVEAAAGPLRSFQMLRPVPPAAAMRVVLMGRTMAGKSTLLAALSGAHEDRIGDGRQRYSRDVLAAPVLTLDGVEIVDTPGVGAHDGEADFEMAMAAVAEADLVVWVASNDSFQEATARALRLVGVMGKPIVVVLNCFKALSDELAMEDFLDDPDEVFAQQEGNFRRIRTHLAAAGVAAVAEISIHAHAAQRAARQDDARLRRASRLDQLLDVLAAERTIRRDARRVLRLVDGSRRTVGALIELLKASAASLSASNQETQSVTADLETRLRREVERTRETLTSTVVRRVAARRDWHTSVTEFGSAVEHQWQAQVAELSAELDAALEHEMSVLAKGVEAVAVATESEWRALPDSYFGVQGLTGFGGVWWNRGSKAAVGLGAAGIAIAVGFLVAGPPGMLAAAGVSLVTPLVVRPIKGLIDRVFTGQAEVLARRRAQIAEQTGPLLDKIADSYRDLSRARIVQVEGQLAVHFHEQVDHARTADAVAAHWSRLADDLERLVETLDHWTVVALLRTTGRERLARSLSRVSRNPGAAILAEFPPAQHAEAWLFPPPMPEPFATAAPAMPGAAAAQALIFLLGLTDARVTVDRLHDDGAELSVDAPIPAGLLDAWAETMAHHTQRPIWLTETSSGAHG